MSKNKKGNYDKEFKSMIVKLYKEGTSVAQLCTDYELNQSNVYKWIDNISSTGTQGNANKNSKPITNENLQKLMCENNELKRENEILEKCVTIFSRN